MPHRDDIEAAQQRADALERELRDAREQLEGLKGNAPPPPPRRGVGVFAVLGIAVMAGGGAMSYLVWQTNAQREREARYRAERAASEAREAERLAEVSSAERAAALERIRQREREAEAERLAQQAATVAGPTQEISWRGTLESTSLPGLRAGDACVLAGEFSGHDDTTRLHALTLRCGVVEVHRQLYAPARPATGLRGGAVYGSGARVYLFRFDDREANGRSVEVSTMQHALSVSGRLGEGAVTRVFLRDVSEPLLDPSVGRVVAARSPAYAGFREESARVSRATGEAPVRAGDRCVVQVRPVWEFPESCRIAVRCGTTWLYGAGEAGYLTCAVRDAQAVSALDENPTSHGGDPRLRWEGRRVVVSDFTEAGAWEVTLGW
ncbi:MAG: hypothetical protein U0325_25515 [Polyangiales bacterium]